jgi:arylsulfatase
MEMMDKLGSPDTYNHYPTGWAVAFSTPYKMFKRYASYAGGTCDPLVIFWPKGIKAKGELRHQYHHCTDIVPTILECCGVEMPETIDGLKQTPLAGVSMKYSFDDASAPTQKETQYYEMAGTRGIWHKGWKAAAEHGPMPSNQGNFDKDRWQLYHTEVDRSEANDVADKYPDKLKELKDLWLEEANKNNVLPLNDVDAATIHEMEFHQEAPASGSYSYYPGTSEVPEASAARTLGASFKALAEVEFTKDTQGVIFAQGSRFGGYTLFVKEGKINFIYNFLGIPPEQILSCDAPKSGKHVIGVEFNKQSISKNLETLGQMKLHLDDENKAEADFRTQSGHYALCGEGLCIGYDGGDAVSSAYTPKFEFKGGEIIKVVFNLSDDAYVDVEKKMEAALARD